MADPVFAVIGEALIDLIDPGGDEPCLAHAGGSPFNVAVGLARLDQPVALLARFSHDGLGHLLRTHAERSGVDLRWARDDTRPSTTALVSLVDGVASYHFTVEGTADFAWTTADLVVPPTARLVHAGSLASWLPPGDAAIAERLAELRAAGDVVISYDPNVRPQLQPDGPAARAGIERAAAPAHIVKASAEDLDWCYPGLGHAAVADRWLAAGARLVIITRGGDGPIAFRSGAAPIERPVRPVTVIDTVGAGDAFTSGLLDALFRAGVTDPGTLDAVLADEDQLAGVLDDAALVAALTCARAGAAPPRRAELDAARSAP